ncbi:MAG: hypothetical protein VW080_00615 [Flavobacteriaceae bacterium]
MPKSLILFLLFHISLVSSLSALSLLQNEFIERNFVFISFEIDTEAEAEEEVTKDFIDSDVSYKSSVFYSKTFRIFYSYLSYPLIPLKQFSPPPEV